MIRFFNTLVVLMFMCCNIFSGENNDLFPDSVNKWSKYNSSKKYAKDDLFTLIDGGAPLYLEYGFIQVNTQRYQNGEKYIDVEIYEMNDSSSAYGIFSLQSFRTGEKIKFSSEASSGEGFMLFWKGKYYITLSMRSSESSGEDTKDLMDLANGIDSRIDAAGKPALAAKLSDQFASKVVYFKGNLGLYNLHIPEADDLVIVKEGYYFEKDNAGIFIFSFDDENESLSQFNQTYELIKKNSESKVKSKEADSFMFSRKNKQITLVKTGKYIAASISEKKAKKNSLLADVKNILSK